jgi:hypothetical protein
VNAGKFCIKSQGMLFAQGLYWHRLAAANETTEAIRVKNHGLRIVMCISFCLITLRTGGAVRTLHAQSKDPSLPMIVQKDGRCDLFVDGALHLNGDQTGWGPSFTTAPQVLRVSLVRTRLAGDQDGQGNYDCRA